MQCSSPRFAVMRDDPVKKGKKQLIFGYHQYLNLYKNPVPGWEPVLLPCGRCLSCKMNKAREWSVRAIHEAQCHEQNCFLTLTYDNAHLPKDFSVSVRALQLFFKRLRKYLDYRKIKVRYLACGEYGSLNGRPHYHICLFGYCPPDLVDISGFGFSRLYTSQIISSLWPYGFNSVGTLTEQSAAYVARYTLKKVDVLNKKRVDGRTPEFIVSSRRPGLGADWFNRFWSDVYNHDRVVLQSGFIARPPKYYDRLLEKSHLSLYNKIKAERQKFAKEHDIDISALHIATVEEIMKIRTGKFKRSLDDHLNMKGGED